MAATAHLTLVAPDNEKCTVQSAPARLPRRKPNAEYLRLPSAAPLPEARRIFQENLDECSMGPFCVEVPAA
jgi:hypothetical protein